MPSEISYLPDMEAINNIYICPGNKSNVEVHISSQLQFFRICSNTRACYPMTHLFKRIHYFVILKCTFGMELLAAFSEITDKYYCLMTAVPRQL